MSQHQTTGWLLYIVANPSISILDEYFQHLNIDTDFGRIFFKWVESANDKSVIWIDGLDCDWIPENERDCCTLGYALNP